MRITFHRKNKGFSSKYIVFIHDCNKEELKMLDGICNDNISVLRSDSFAMVTFNREEDFNWYMLKWK